MVYRSGPPCSGSGAAGGIGSAALALWLTSSPAAGWRSPPTGSPAAIGGRGRFAGLSRRLRGGAGVATARTDPGPGRRERPGSAGRALGLAALRDASGMA